MHILSLFAVPVLSLLSIIGVYVYAGMYSAPSKPERCCGCGEVLAGGHTCSM